MSINFLPTLKNIIYNKHFITYTVLVFKQKKITTNYKLFMKHGIIRSVEIKNRYFSIFEIAKPVF